MYVLCGVIICAHSQLHSTILQLYVKILYFCLPWLIRLALEVCTAVFLYSVAAVTANAATVAAAASAG